MASAPDFVAFMGRQKALLSLADTCVQYGDHKTSEEFWSGLPHVLAALGVLIEASSVDGEETIAARAVAEFCKFFHIPEPDTEEFRRKHEDMVRGFGEIFKPE